MSIQVAELYVYPVKSLRGIKVGEAILEEEGLRYDRRWMITDPEGNFVTQREASEMAKFSCQIADNALQVSYEGETLSIPTTSKKSMVRSVQVWSSKLKAEEIDPAISHWFSERLNRNVHFVAKTTISKRSKRLFVPPYKTKLSLADGYPVLLLGTESVRVLNEKCPEDIPADRFRANVILETDAPHIEDEWGALTIGGSQLQVIKPCARCVMITIDQLSGERSKEPLRTLASYRKKRNKILFGANAICVKEGLIRVGDTVLV